MRKLLYILLLMLVVGTVGCHRTSEAEARLIAIDSLIPADPDSALTLLEAIEPRAAAPKGADAGGSPDTRKSHADAADYRDRLPASRLTRSERAYGALLTVQALYKAYIPATSDSLINIAWDYYKDHGPYDRRIRAMLYKGTTAEELGHPDTAMYWYKRTELESRPDDHYHRGYAQMAMGTYYQESFLNNIAISKYRSAIKEFETIKDTIYLTYCANELSKLYSFDNLDSSFYYANKLVSLAANPEEKLLNILSRAIIKENILFYDSCFAAAKDSALVIIKNLDNPPKELYYHIAESYYRIGNVDSAQYYYNNCPLPENKKDSVLYFRLVSLINGKNGNWERSTYFLSASDELGEEIVDEGNKISNSYQQIESEQERVYLTKYHNKWGRFALYTILALMSVVLVAIILGKLKRQKINHELKDLQLQYQKLELLYQHLVELKNPNSELVENQANTFKYILTQVQKSMSDKYNKDSYKSAIKRAFTPVYFSHLRKYVDFAHDGLATSMSDSGLLEEKEVNVICMYLSRLPNSIINLYIGHSSTQNAIRYRNNIAKKYFGDKDKLKVFLN